MIVILVIITSLARLKQKITCYHFKDSASQAPYIRWGIVVSTYDDLWRPILSSLNLWSEMMIGPAAVTHVTYLYHYVLINFRSSLTLTGLLLTIISTSTCIVELIIIIKKIANWFLGVIYATLFCMDRLFLLFGCWWLLWLFWFFGLFIIIPLFTFFITAFSIFSIATLVLLLLSLQLLL